ncbi:MAG TPA: hypothetical protein VLN59_16675 [Burkholderiales bacterium]|nr:hypothetical protein [Burkholderiales bacterium]
MAVFLLADFSVGFFLAGTRRFADFLAAACLRGLRAVPFFFFTLLAAFFLAFPFFAFAIHTSVETRAWQRSDDTATQPGTRGKFLLHTESDSIAP